MESSRKEAAPRYHSLTYVRDGAEAARVAVRLEREQVEAEAEHEKSRKEDP